MKHSIIKNIVLLFALVVMNCGDATLSKEEVKALNEISVLYRNKKFDSVIEKIKPLLKEDRAHVEAHVLLAKTQFFIKQPKKAEKTLKNILSVDPENPHILTWLGKTLLLLDGREKEAADIFRNILKRNPENYMAHYYLGRSLEAQKKMGVALKQYERALAVEYQISNIHYHMAGISSKFKSKEISNFHISRARLLRNLNPVADSQSLVKNSTHK